MNNLAVTEYKEQRVLTTQQIAEAYNTSADVITKNFNRNKERYIAGKHFVCLEGEELKNFKTNGQIDLSLKINKLYLWTKKGAFLHAKSLNTDIAWEVYDRLVDSYFEHQKPVENPLAGISHELKAVIVVDKRVTQVEERIEKLENNMTVTHEMLQTIKNRVNKKVTSVLGGYESNAYKDKHLRGKVYSRFNRDYCNYFRINARANTLASKFEGALSYIDMWLPDTNLAIQIKDCNAQINMGVV